MSLTSAQFFLFFAISLLIYYLLPGKIQWIALLIFSVSFYVLSAAPYTGVYLLTSIVATTICVNWIARCKQEKKETGANVGLIVALVVNIGLLALLKYSNFVSANVNRIAAVLGVPLNIPSINLLPSLGISFYTMQVLAYILDSYWGIITPETNLFKTALFIGYYPQLTSGPIARFQDVGPQLFAGHRFDARVVSSGAIRILWGVFKKLVIASRCGIIVDTIFADTVTYQGLYIWLAAALFMMQLYADFSGCMDIIIGASECYGVVLPENFRTPFFSHSVQEFWQRWHITLGGFMRDYVMYPVLRSKLWRKMTKWLKSHWGKKAAKQIPSYLGMLCVWLLMGLWHGGGWKYIIGQGMWFWSMIVLSQIFEPCFKKLHKVLKIDTECFSWRLFQSVRVFFLVCIGNIFFRLGSFGEAFRTIKIGLTNWDVRFLLDGSLYQLGLGEKDFRLMVISLVVLLIVDLLSDKDSVRKRLSRQNIGFRYLILLLLIFAILIFGMYGIGYDAQSFIYEGF